MVTTGKIYISTVRTFYYFIIGNLHLEFTYNSFYSTHIPDIVTRVFHKLEEIGNNANTGISGKRVTPSEDRTRTSHEPLIPSPTPSFLS